MVCPSGVTKYAYLRRTERVFSVDSGNNKYIIIFQFGSASSSNVLLPAVDEENN